MIKITLKLFVTLSKYLPGDSETIEIPEKTSVGQLIQDLNIPPASVKLVFVNSKKHDFDYQLKENDRLGLFPPVGGG